MRSTADMLPKGKDRRNSYIPPKWDDMRSIADITKLGVIASKTKKEEYHDYKR